MIRDLAGLRSYITLQSVPGLHSSVQALSQSIHQGLAPFQASPLVRGLAICYPDHYSLRCSLQSAQPGEEQGRQTGGWLAGWMEVVCSQSLTESEVQRKGGRITISQLTRH